MKYRYKEISPLDTIKNISEYLLGLGLYIKHEWFNSNVKNIFSVRISIYGTNYGANGKGINKEYALASAYGELIERIANGIIFKNNELLKTHDIGFIYFPDEINISEEYYSNIKNEIVDGILNIVVNDKYNTCKQKLTKKEAMDLWKKYEIKNDWISIPFKRETDGKIYYVPYKMMKVYGSNGMSAGNSYNEAFVQACSEIFERYCQINIIENNLCPPIISRNMIELHFKEISDIISEIELDNNFYVEFRDCSLNKGFPVVCVCIYDKQKHTEIVSFGAHPNIEIAMERALTEAFQGRNKQNVCNNIENRNKDKRLNISSLLKNGIGYYPYLFYSNKESYCCKTKEFFKKFANNNELKNEILRICKNNKLNIYVHSVILMNMSCLQIIIPGLSEVFCYDNFQFQYKEMKEKTKIILSNIDKQSFTSIEAALEFIDYSRKIAEFDFNLSKEILVDDYDAANQEALWILINGFIYLGKYDRAIAYLRLSSYKESISGKCLIKFLELLLNNIDLNTAKYILNKFFEKKYVDSAMDILFQSKDTIKNLHTFKMSTNKDDAKFLSVVKEIKKGIRVI